MICNSLKWQQAKSLPFLIQNNRKFRKKISTSCENIPSRSFLIPWVSINMPYQLWQKSSTNSCFAMKHTYVISLYFSLPGRQTFAPQISDLCVAYCPAQGVCMEMNIYYYKKILISECMTFYKANGERWITLFCQLVKTYNLFLPSVQLTAHPSHNFFKNQNKNSVRSFTSTLHG